MFTGTALEGAYARFDHSSAADVPEDVLTAWLRYFGAFLTKQEGMARVHLENLVTTTIARAGGVDGRLPACSEGEWERAVMAAGVRQYGVPSGGPGGLVNAGWVPLTQDHVQQMSASGCNIPLAWRAIQTTWSCGGVQGKNLSSVMTDIDFSTALVLRRDFAGNADWSSGVIWHIAYEARCREKGGTYTAIMTFKCNCMGADAAQTLCVRDCQCDCIAGYVMLQQERMHFTH